MEILALLGGIGIFGGVIGLVVWIKDKMHQAEVLKAEQELVKILHSKKLKDARHEFRKASEEYEKFKASNDDDNDLPPAN